MMARNIQLHNFLLRCNRLRQSVFDVFLFSSVCQYLSFGFTNFAFAGRQNPHCFAILCNRSPRNADALVSKERCDFAVAERLGRIFATNEFANFRAYGRRGLVFAVRRRKMTGEEVFELKHATWGMHVLVGRNAGYGRFMHAN